MVAGRNIRLSYRGIADSDVPTFLPPDLTRTTSHFPKVGNQRLAQFFSVSWPSVLLRKCGRNFLLILKWASCLGRAGWCNNALTVGPDQVGNSEVVGQRPRSTSSLFRPSPFPTFLPSSVV